MKKTAAVLLTLFIATLAIGGPILLALEESRRQGYKDETDRALLYAKDVLRRSDATADQVSRAFKQLAGIPVRDACADTSIALMQELDLASSYVQSYGFVVSDQLICSSLGVLNPPMALGPADLTTATGIRIRRNVQLATVPGITFITLEQDGYTAIIHKDLPIDTTTRESDTALAIFSAGHLTPLSARGVPDPAWIAALKDRNEIAFSDGRYIVGVVRSTRYKAVAVAAIPVAYLQERTSAAAKRLVPVGLIAGIFLAVAILQLARMQLALPAAIRAALRRGEFFLLYQPIVDLESGRWVGAEALIRWRRATGEVIPPDFFIPIAEQSGLITRITERVLTLAATDTGASWRAQPDFHIAINLSAADLHSEATPALLMRFLERTGARPGNLIVEATERGFLQVELATKISNAIRDQGIAIAIDDFGTGYSSLSYLQSLTLDFLKIDKSFIDTVGTEAPTSQVVTHIIAMARDLGLALIAEGVETQAQADYLRERGVRYAQGWLYGRPMPWPELIRRVRADARALPATEAASQLT